MSLELIVGPMFSGKSTELIRRVKRLQTIGKSLAIYNSVNDDRYGIDGIYTHDMKSVHCIATDTLMSQLNTETFENAEYIFIDEAQFFKDLFNFVRDIVETRGKHVIVIGLNGDSNRWPFGQINDLVPYCDDIIMLKALCSQCKDGTPAIFSKRISENSGQICVGSVDIYIATCRKCYLKQSGSPDGLIKAT